MNSTDISSNHQSHWLTPMIMIANMAKKTTRISLKRRLSLPAPSSCLTPNLASRRSLSA